MFPLYYIGWHYTKGLRALLGMLGNYLWFFWHLFSIPLLFRTLFSPWKRLHEERQPGLHLGDWVGVLIINIIMRLLGSLIRLTTIATGVFMCIFTFTLSLILTILWLTLPLSAPSLFIAGIILII